MFEWFTGGGRWADHNEVHEIHDMLGQGAAMLEVAAADFVDAGHEIVVAVDQRLMEHSALAALVDQATNGRIQLAPVDAGSHSLPPGDHARLILKNSLMWLANQVEAVLVVAPETDCRLEQVTQWFETRDLKCLGPDASFIRLAGDKNRLSEWLRQRGFERHPPGLPLTEFLALDSSMQSNWLPCVMKPFDGAGSEDALVIASLEPLRQHCDSTNHELNHWRIEQFVAGIPASISVVGGRGGQYQILPPTIQKFDKHPFGNYVGADYPLDPGLAVRAVDLARQAIAALPPTTGYVGMDIVLGEKEDWLIEINPRLTTSYVTLRQQAGFSLADSLLPRQ